MSLNQNHQESFLLPSVRLQPPGRDANNALSRGADAVAGRGRGMVDTTLGEFLFFDWMPPRRTVCILLLYVQFSDHLLTVPRVRSQSSF